MYISLSKQEILADVGIFNQGCVGGSWFWQETNYIPVYSLQSKH